MQLLTQVGEATSAATILGAGAALAAASLVTGRWERPLLIAGGAFFVAQGMFSGHHLDLDGMRSGPSLVAHLAHLFAGGLWTASIVALLFDRSREQLLASSRRATLSIAVLFPSALVLTATLAWPWQDAGRDWWVNLLVKSALVGAAFALGAWHHRRVRAGSDIGWASVAAEVAVMATVLAAAATLTQHTPAAVVAQRAAVTAAGSTADEAVGPATYPLSFDDGSTGELELVPRAGNESMWMLTLTGADGKPLAAQTVAVGIANPRAGVEQLAVTLDGMSDHWMGANTIPFAGSWSVAVAVYLDEFTVVNANTTMEIAG
jgi:hypothetical protein